MDKIKKFLIDFSNGDIIGVDKFLHFSFSYLIVSLFKDPYVGFGMVILINLLKEVFDEKIKKTKFDLKDSIAGIIGGLFYLLIHYLKNR